MGSALSVKVLFIGLDNSGKTSMVDFLEMGPNTQETVKSTAFETKILKYKGVVFSIYDVAGSSDVRDLWKHYYEGTQAIVWVVDSLDKERFDESKDALQTALKAAAMDRTSPCLVACTKCSKKGAKSPDDISKALSLDSLLQGREWTCMATDSKDGTGVYECFKWLSDKLKAAHKAAKKKAKE